MLILATLIACTSGASVQDIELIETESEPTMETLQEDTADTSDQIRSLISSGGFGVPFLYPPLQAPANTPNMFNHAPDPSMYPGKELIFTGQVLSGDPNHYAYDWVTDIGTPVYAPASGIVVSAYEGVDNCPKLNPTKRPAKSVRILHENTSPGIHYSTLYLHLDSIAVSKDANIAKGDLIGLTGNSGCSNLPHLHFSVSRINNVETMRGSIVDPFGWKGKGEDPRPVDSVNLWIEAPTLLRAGKPVLY